MAASSSRLLKLTLSSYFLRSCRLASSSLLPTASRCHPGPLHSLRFCSAVPAVVDVAADPAEAVVSAGHPWPEWGDFLDKLRAKGYFEQGRPSSGVSSGEGTAGDGDAAVAAASENAAAAASGNMVAAAADSAVGSEDIYPFRDENRVKNACLKFARDRYDLLRCKKPCDSFALSFYAGIKFLGLVLYVIIRIHGSRNSVLCCTNHHATDLVEMQTQIANWAFWCAHETGSKE